jgi:hypothetical protein
MKDPIVAEVRKYRMEHAKKFNYNSNDIYNDIEEYQNKLKRTGCINKDHKFVSDNFKKEFLLQKQK